MSEQSRNAAAGQRQQQYMKKQKQAENRDLSSSSLTRKNSEFIFQLNKQLENIGFDANNRQQAVNAAKKRLLEEQKRGRTAKQIFGTPTAYAHELANPKKEDKGQSNSQYGLLALDNGLMFFAIFALMFGVLAFMNPSSLVRNGHYGNSGILAILIVAATGGLLFGYIARIMAPYKDENGEWKTRSWGYKALMIVLAFMLWIGAYFLVGGLPNSINPQPNKWLYIILGIVVFAGDLWLRARFHIVNNVFGGNRAGQQKK